jgi:hypothetical protein
MALTRLTLRLGRNPDAGFPDGDPERGYVIVAPLDREGRLDPEAWKARKADCVVLRVSPDPDETADGWLIRRGQSWHLHYDEEHEGPDEPVFRLGDHRLLVGDYVTIHEADGDDLVYRVDEARPVP